MSWSIALTVAAVVASVVAVALVSLVLAPVWITLDVTRRRNGAISVRGQVRPWCGLLGVTARLENSALRFGPAICGRAPGPWFRLATGEVESSPDTARTGREGGASERADGKAPLGGDTQPPAATAPPPSPPGTDPGAGAAPDEDTAAAESETESETEPEAEAGTAPLAGPLGRLRRLALIGRTFAGPALRLIRACPTAFSLRRLRLEGRIGLEDPAATGSVFGLLQALRALAPDLLELSVAPSFQAPGIAGRARARAHLYPARLLLSLARFAAIAAWRWLRLRLHRRRQEAQPAAG